jgi:hypothetical protein
VALFGFFEILILGYCHEKSGTQKRNGYGRLMLLAWFPQKRKHVIGNCNAYREPYVIFVIPPMQNVKSTMIYKGSNAREPITKCGGKRESFLRINAARLYLYLYPDNPVTVVRDLDLRPRRSLAMSCSTAKIKKRNAADNSWELLLLCDFLLQIIMYFTDD